jgi:L-asparaginase
VRGRALVHVLFTGGTISVRRDPVTGAALPALSGREIVARVPGLRREARLRLEDLARLPGPHVTPSWMWRLRRRVERVLSDPAVDGVVITHGTDTLEETAYLLDLTLASPKPVVLCGAMRTFSDPGWDGPANLTAAVRTAAHPDAGGRGALVVVGEEIHALYGFEGGGQRLAALGVILAGDLGGPKARIKLMVALGSTSDPQGLRAIFEG